MQWWALPVIFIVSFIVSFIVTYILSGMIYFNRNK